MNRRGDPSSILIFLLLIIAVLFQVNLYTKNRRLDQDFSRFMSAQAETGSEKNVHSERDTTLLKDEGVWLAEGFSLGPETLNEINVDRDIYTKRITTPFRGE